MTESAERTPIGQEAQRDWSTIRCVLWHAPTRPPPRDLTRLLDERGVQVAVATNPYLALATLCRFAAEARRSGHLAPLALLAVGPESLPRFEEVVRAARTYAPQAVCWVDDPDSTPRLRAVRLDRPRPEVVVRPEPAPVSKPTQDQSVQEFTSTSSGPVLRLTDAETPPRREPDDAPGATFLTDEELALLLAEDDET